MSDIDQHQSTGQSHETLTAKQAADLLGVKLPTLYAYASRGMIRSLPGPQGRARRYQRGDLERLRSRRDARMGHGPAAAGALRWGEPVLDTHITAITSDTGPIYRGRAATALAAQDVPFEAVAELLWSGSLPTADATPRWVSHELPFSIPSLRRLVHPRPTAIEALSVVVPLLGGRDPGRFAEGPEAVLPRARVLLRRMAAALAPGFDDERMASAFAAPDLASAVAAALDAKHGARGVRAIGRALVLGADHELNASAFAARVAASTGADLYACVSAALAALSGPRHGGALDRIEALVAEIGRPEDAERVVHERARRGEAIEGFDHPLYPNGDPRGSALVELAEKLEPRSPAVRTCLELVKAMEASGASGATLDAGLVAIAAALGLPRGAATGLFAIGRCAGWVAHALEQSEAGYLLRPRARYSDA
jgi:citrate synthase